MIILKKCMVCTVALSLILSVSACSNSSNFETTGNQSSSDDVTSAALDEGFVEHIENDSKFGQAIVRIDPEAFEAYGFDLGDSVNIMFSNGYTLRDVPYYNGFYVNAGEPVMVAYPGKDYLLITLNYKGIWDEAGLTEGDTVKITLNASGKYRATQEALGQSYSFEKTDEQTNEEFANFRALSGGNLKENLLFRGASAVDYSRGRARYVDDLLEKNEIRFLMDLADSEENIQEYMAGDAFESDYAKALYESGSFALLSLSSDYESEAYHEGIAEGLKKMTECGGPAYIYCTEGKDRTGFVCMLIEALAGASYEEMADDYMTTYENYYEITEDKTPDRYEAVLKLYFNTYMEYLHGSSDTEKLKTADFTEDARNYLKDGGMTDREIDDFLDMIKNNDIKQNQN